MIPAFADRRWAAGTGLWLYARDYAAASGDARLPVVCLHGLTRNSKDFSSIAYRLAASGRRVLVPEMRGRGKSDRDPDPRNYHHDTYALDVMGLAKALGIERAIFIGTSMGGVIATAAADLRPELVAAIVFNDIGPEAAPEGLRRIAGYVGKASPVRTWDDAAAQVRALNECSFPLFGPDDWRGLAQRTYREDEAGAPVLDYDPAIARPLDEHALRPEESWRRFEAVTATRPVLLIRGALSDILDRSITAKMTSSAPAMEVVEVDDVGHAPMLTEPQAVKAIGEFLHALP